MATQFQQDTLDIDEQITRIEKMQTEISKMLVETQKIVIEREYIHKDYTLRTIGLAVAATSALAVLFGAIGHYLTR
jgi:hypothetical protein